MRPLISFAAVALRCASVRTSPRQPQSPDPVRRHACLDGSVEREKVRLKRYLVDVVMMSAMRLDDSVICPMAITADWTTRPPFRRHLVLRSRAARMLCAIGVLFDVEEISSRLAAVSSKLAACSCAPEEMSCEADDSCSEAEALGSRPLGPPEAPCARWTPCD